MTVETHVLCNRCNRRLVNDEGLRLTIQPSEDSLLHASENIIDLCHVCEADMVKFMAGEVFHQFIEKS